MLPGMEFSQNHYLYNKPSFLQNASDSSLGEGEEYCPYPTPFHFSHTPSDTPPQIESLPFSTTNANLFQQREQEELEQILRQDETFFRRETSGVESWQGDWQLANSTPGFNSGHPNESPHMVHSANASMETFPTIDSMQPTMMVEDRRRRGSSDPLNTIRPEMGAPGTLLPANLAEPFQSREQQQQQQRLDKKSSDAVLPTDEIPEQDVSQSLPNTDIPVGSHPESDVDLFKVPLTETCLPNWDVQQGSRIEKLQAPKRSTSNRYNIRSAPPNIHTYPQPPPVMPSRNNIFNFCSDVSTGELGWNVEQQGSRFQTSPLLNAKMKFPTRPLIPGVLAKIHNDWLEEYPQPSPPMCSAALDGEANRDVQITKRFPTPHMTFESQHIRILWQELERRRILEMTDVNLINRLRQEARLLLKSEALYYSTANVMYSSYNHEELLESIPEPNEVQLDLKVQMLWEQTKKSAVYAVGLLRQAEYCIAHGHLGFMPLNHVQRAPMQQHVERGMMNGQQACDNSAKKV